MLALAEDRSGAASPRLRETIVVHKGHGLPYSKGLMAQALSAIGALAGARVRAGPR